MFGFCCCAAAGAPATITETIDASRPIKIFLPVLILQPPVQLRSGQTIRELAFNEGPPFIADIADPARSIESFF
jgi:hypothetical protein